MKNICINCDLEVKPYVTPHGAHWKSECPLCNSVIEIIKDQQPPDDEYLAYALARRKPRTKAEADWLNKRNDILPPDSKAGDSV